MLLSIKNNIIFSIRSEFRGGGGGRKGGGTAATEVYDGAAERTASIRIGKKDGKLDIRVESEKAYRIELVNVKASSVTTEDGRISMEYRDNCTIITAEGSRQICCGL